VSLKVTLNDVDKTRRRTLERIERAAYGIEREAKQRAPIKTGFLRNSITTERQSETEAVVNVSAEYGSYVEHGTRFTPAQPFIRPAVEAVRARFLKDVSAAIE
jgi:HK97 gp10 family phage protein